MGEKRSSAIFAGLLGAATLATPNVAHALTIAGAIDHAFPTPTSALLAGFAGGVALAGAVGGVASRLALRGAEGDAPLIERAAPRHLRSEEPQAASGEAPAPARPAGPRHSARDYEDIAENYVRRFTVRDRMARRAEGVAATLRERMGAARMDGVPVIARADGSVGDVGTAWWQHAVGAGAIISDAGFAPEDSAAFAIPSDFSTTDKDRLALAARRAQGIASRVAFVEEGAFPEHRTVEDLDTGDTWASALRGLDEKIASIAPVQDEIEFIDGVGGSDTLDEPDNLEPQTAFMPFRAPGGHPEVVDTETYVDYLIEDEFSKNSSTAARRSSRRFLRVLEGGSAPMSRHLAGTVSSDPVYLGKHFAVPTTYAAEA